ncbi:hypothetical protein LUZ60_007748 [Juncus effusus]|nr:hypothetical protein LUZ60_007748 [Juncus effusus]
MRNPAVEESVLNSSSPFHFLTHSTSSKLHIHSSLMSAWMHASRPSISFLIRNMKTALRAGYTGFYLHTYKLSSFKHVKMRCKCTAAKPITYEKVSKDNKTVPYSDPPASKDVNLLHEFIDRSSKLMVLTGAGISTESGIPDYRSPNGAYSTGFKPITHQEFVRSNRFRRRYWARSYAGWRRFIKSKPNTAHYALATLEKVGRVNFMVTQNVDRLHHKAGSNPLELHGTVFTVVCLDCDESISRESFQDQLKTLNPKWASEIESLENGYSGSDESLGVQRPDADVEIDKKFWEENFEIPECKTCGGILKPDVVFFGDNVPKERADKSIEGARECDAFLVLGSSLMTMSAFRLARSAHEAKAPIAIVNIGDTRADDLVSLKINARCGEILPRLLDMGRLAVPSIS